MAIQIFTSLIDFVSCFTRSLPEGRLYSYAKTSSSNFFQFCCGLLSPYYNWLNYANKAIQDLNINVYNPDPTNMWLDNFCKECGLAKYGFDLRSNEMKAFSLSIFFRIRNAITVQDIINIFADLGYDITIINGTQYGGNWDKSNWDSFFWDFSSEKSIFVVYVSIRPSIQVNNAITWDNFTWDNSDWSSQLGLDIYFVKNILQYIFPCYIKIINY